MACMSLLQALRLIKNEGPLFPDEAICFNVEFTAGLWAEWEMLVLAEQWCKERGVVFNPSWFINGHCAGYCRDAHQEGGFWANPLRMQFVEWAIERLEQNVARGF